MQQLIWLQAQSCILAINIPVIKVDFSYLSTDTQVYLSIGLNQEGKGRIGVIFCLS